MRVTLLCADRGVPLGGPKGCSVHLRAVAAAVRRAGHEVRVLVVDPGPEAPRASLEAAGVEVVPLEGVQALTDLQVILGRRRPDLVLERLALFAPAGARAAANLGVPHVYEANAPLDEEALAYRGLADLDGARGALAAGFAESSGAVAVSEEVARWVGRHAPPGYPVRVVPNGVDPAFLEDPDPAALEAVVRRLRRPTRFRVGFAGSLRPWHDVPGLLRALTLVSDRLALELVVIGDGPERNALLRLAAELKVRTIHVGHVPHEEVRACLALCHVVAVPYATPDAYSSPLKLAEAMAAGRPVVASATGPCRALVRDGVDGLLVPPGDLPALAEAIERLAQDRELRERLGRAARARMRERGTWDHVVGEVLDFARSVAKRRRLS